jgi:hypothetical protein
MVTVESAPLLIVPRTDTGEAIVTGQAPAPVAGVSRVTVIGEVTTRVHRVFETPAPELKTNPDAPPATEVTVTPPASCLGVRSVADVAQLPVMEEPTAMTNAASAEIVTAEVDVPVPVIVTVAGTVRTFVPGVMHGPVTTAPTWIPLFKGTMRVERAETMK